MGDVLRELVGRKVTAFTDSGAAEARDVGILEGYDAQWIKLRKGESEVLYLNVARTRLIKPFDAA